MPLVAPGAGVPRRPGTRAMLQCMASTRSVTPTVASKASRPTPRRSEGRIGALAVIGSHGQLDAAARHGDSGTDPAKRPGSSSVNGWHPLAGWLAGGPREKKAGRGGPSHLPGKLASVVKELQRLPRLTAQPGARARGGSPAPTAGLL